MLCDRSVCGVPTRRTRGPSSLLASEVASSLGGSEQPRASIKKQDEGRHCEDATAEYGNRACAPWMLPPYPPSSRGNRPFWRAQTVRLHTMTSTEPQQAHTAAVTMERPVEGPFEIEIPGAARKDASTATATATDKPAWAVEESSLQMATTRPSSKSYEGETVVLTRRQKWKRHWTRFWCCYITLGVVLLAILLPIL